MTEPNQPEIALPEGFQTGAVFTRPTPAEDSYPLRLDQYQTLCDGSSGNERANRDFYKGLFFGALLGVIGFVAGIDWASFWAKKSWVLLGCLVVLLSIFLWSLVEWIGHNKKLGTEDTTYTRLKKTISQHFQSCANRRLTQPATGSSEVIQDETKAPAAAE